MRNTTNLILIATALSLALNGCGARPSPVATPSALTSTSMPPSLALVFSTPANTSTPKVKTIVVNNTADRGSGTLRQALLDAIPGDTITLSQNIHLVVSVQSEDNKRAHDFYLSEKIIR